MFIVGTPYFASITKACDYYKDQGYFDGDSLEDLKPAELERLIRAKVDEGEIYIGKPEIEPGERLLLIDGGTRYAIERP